MSIGSAMSRPTTSAMRASSMPAARTRPARSMTTLVGHIRMPYYPAIAPSGRRPFDGGRSRAMENGGASSPISACMRFQSAR